MNRKIVLKKLPGLALLGPFAYGTAALATDGHVLHGVGSVSQSMGGASIATSLDAIGSNTTNVSSIAFLQRSSIEFGAELFAPDRSYSASSPAPTSTGFASGTVDSKTREAVIPSFGLVYKTGGPWTFGFSAVGVGGFGVDYPSNAFNTSGHFNPVALPQSQGGFGSVYSNYQLLQLTPSAAYQVNDKWSVGLGINADWASLAVDPWPATPPNASGFPSGSHAATAWGGGFTLGTTYKVQPNLAVGLSVKSPQWFGKFNWNSQFPDGTPTNFGFRLDYPLIVGAGLSYQPIDKLTLAADLKWINYSGTKGLSEKNWGNAGTTAPFVRGFGWEDIWAFSAGAQYQVTDRLKLRAGYNYGDNPIPSSQQFFNVFAPAIVQHHATIGAGFSLTDNLELNLGYYHAFQNEKSGSFINPANNQPIPGTKITNKLSEDTASAQVSLKF